MSAHEFLSSTEPPYTQEYADDYQPSIDDVDEEKSEEQIDVVDDVDVVVVTNDRPDASPNDEDDRTPQSHEVDEGNSQDSLNESGPSSPTLEEVIVEEKIAPPPRPKREKLGKMSKRKKRKKAAKISRNSMKTLLRRAGVIDKFNDVYGEAEEQLRAYISAIMTPTIHVMSLSGRKTVTRRDVLRTSAELGFGYYG